MNSHFCKLIFYGSTDYIVKNIKEKPESFVFEAYDKIKEKYFINNGVKPIISNDFFFFLTRSLTILHRL